MTRIRGIASVNSCHSCHPPHRVIPASVPQCPWLLQYPQWSQDTEGSMMQASVELMTVKYTPWLGCGPCGAAALTGNDSCSGGRAPPMCLATASRTSARKSWSFTDRYLVDDADDRGIDRRRLPAQCGARGLALDHDQHALANSRADRVDGQHRHASRLAVERKRLHQQQLRALELAMLLRGNDSPDHATNLHGLLEIPVIH